MSILSEDHRRYNPLALFNPLRPRNQVAILGAMALAGTGPVGASKIAAGTAFHGVRTINTFSPYYRAGVGPALGIYNLATGVDSLIKYRRGTHQLAIGVKYAPYLPWWAIPIPHIGHLPFPRPYVDIGTRRKTDSRRAPLQQRPRRGGPTTPHRASRSPSVGRRRRKRCPPGFRRVGNRCVPIRKGGRRRYN